MKRNEAPSKSSPVMKLVVAVLAAALSACAVTGPSSDDMSTDVSFNGVHHGP